MNIAIIFGGKSAEHEVSIQSAKNVVKTLDKDKFNPILIGISKSGKWFLLNNVPENEVKEKGELLTIKPGSGKRFLSPKVKSIDAVFPVLHGPNGEDGTIQGLFKMVDIPFVAPGVLGSASAMDKEVSKLLMEAKGIDVADWLTFEEKVDLELVEKKFNYPVFVKPANLGSSVGVSKAKNRKELKVAIKEAFNFDNKILVEEFIDGKELECSVLGNTEPKASKVGEIKPKDFYSYKEKYSDESNTELIIPADINKSLEGEIRKIAIQAFKANMCEGMARVDFLVAKDRIYVNEINTIPGFTKISMYPKLWDESGLKYQDLITKLIELGLQRYEKENKLKTSY
ncbi:MAG: D-alanine--D-alanine ligase family protein [Patescibacteria group bacterium]